MANKKSKKQDKSKVVGICVAVVAIVVIIIAIVAASMNQGLSEGYFKSDDTKYVLTIETDEDAVSDEEEYVPIKTHIVYFYEGDNITGLSVYQEYADNATAKAAADYYADSESYKELYADGKYLVAVMNEEDYEGVTVESVKQQLEFIEAMKSASENGGLVDDGSDDELIETTDEEETEE